MIEPQQSEEKEVVNILMVDDKPENLLALEQVLSAQAYRLTRALSGKEALRLVLRADFAMILLDVRMPVMDGFETAELIRQRKKNRDIPIIFISAESAARDHIARGYALNAVDFLIKPFDPDRLRGRVALLAELHRKTVQLETSNRKLQAEIRERKRVEKDLSRRVAQQDQEIQSLERLAAAPGTVITARQFGQGPLKETAPDNFHELIGIYCDLLDKALEQRTYKVERDLSIRLRSLAEQLGFLSAKPRDLVEMHSTALKSKIKAAPHRKTQAYMDEARLMILECMGYLASYYRDRY
jgi:response regulator RpfG family c-di-GMP phosphodiesterase